jgi:N6-adenosine-specific RNA methylase IME4
LTALSTASSSQAQAPQTCEHALPFHPLADIFPLLEGAAFDELVADIHVHGIREPIWLYEGKILDGRNRYRAAVVAGVQCPTRVYEGDNPIAFVISLNLKRRHLNESQRAMVAAKLATLGMGANQHSEGPSIEGASRLLNVGHASVERAKAVHRDGAPELVRAVERGDVSVSAAADIAGESVEQQREIVARGEREILRVAKDIRARKATDKHAVSIKRLAEISEGTRALPTGQRFPVIYADPPWRFAPYDSVTGTARTPEAHYPCMQTKEIADLPIAKLATEDAILFLWTTAPHLQQAFHVIEAWGFRYATNVVWVKDQIGLGFYVRNQHELLLIATHGFMRAPPPAQRPPSVITAPRREHSRKPDEAYEIIERMYPGLPKIELFARARRPGWDCWGNQAPPPQGEWNEMWARPFDHTATLDVPVDGGESRMAAMAPRAGACEMPDIPDFLRRTPPGPSS